LEVLPSGGFFTDFFQNIAMDRPAQQIFEFGPFSLDAAEHTLRRNGRTVPLRPKVFDILLVLVERRGHLVGKEELLESVWPEQHVEEGNLNKTVSLLRLALGEGGDGGIYIETVPKRGYRFVAPLRTKESGATVADHVDHTDIQSRRISVDVLEGATATASPNPPADALVPLKKRPAARWSSPKTLTALGVVIVASLIGAVGVGYYFFHSMKTEGGDRKSIAVLPIKPIDTANRDEIYEVGIADSLIIKLSSMKGLLVRPLSATRKYADLAQDPIAAGKEQQVDYVLASNYQLVGGKIRITSQLFHVANGQVEETYKSEKDAGDVFAMQDAVARELGDKLSVRLVVQSGGLAGRRGTTNEEAYRLYHQAMYLYDRRNPANARKAVELLERAIQLDPAFARAWAGKAHVHRALANFSGNTHEEYRKSMEAINRALELDNNLADAHSALCENKFFYERDFAGAELECKRAIELDPNSSLGHQVYSRNLMVQERFDESIAEIKTAIDLEPTSLFSQRNFGIAFYYARRYPEAVAQFKRVTEMDPTFEATYPWLINTLKLQGNEVEAFEWFMKWQGVQEADKDTLQAFKTAYQRAGWRGLGLERVKRFDESKIRTYFMEACMAAQADNKNKALEYLETSYQRREWGMAFIRFEPALDVLRGDPRFDDLVRRVGLQ
jgi:DNA-binding winged helix-turn-helix (wHTH) protein/tetratricopeptide (TPR) repeat protein